MKVGRAFLFANTKALFSWLSVLNWFYLTKRLPELVIF